MLPELKNPIWHSITFLSIKPYSCGMVCLATKMPDLSPFLAKSIEKTFAIGRDMDYVENEDKRFGVFLLNDGRWALIRALWDKNSWSAYAIEAEVSCFQDEMIRFGLTERERRLLHIELPEEK